MNTIEQALEVAKRLSIGATIARERRIDHDFAVLADHASSAIDALIAELAALKSQEPVAWQHCFTDPSRTILSYTPTCAGFPPRSDAWKVNPLFLSAGPQEQQNPVARVNKEGFIVELDDVLIAPGQFLYLKE